MRPQSNPSMENNITLYGASGHCKVIADILMGNGNTQLTIIDDFGKNDHILGVPVVKTSDIDMEKLDNLIISIGNNRARKRISSKLDIRYANALHASAIISPFSQIGAGTVVMAGAKINPDAKIGKHCIINTGAVVEHDADIADFVHISPGAALAGNVTVGEGSHVGIGSIVIQGVKIGKWATIGAGAIIIRDIPDFAVVVGNPGKIIKYNEEYEH